MVYPTLPKQIEQKTIRENYVDPLDPFLKKNFQNPTTQDPNSKIHIEQIQNHYQTLKGLKWFTPHCPNKLNKKPSGKTM